MAKPVPLHVLQRDEKELSEVKNSGKYLDCFSITLYTMLGIGTPLKWMTELWWELQMELSSSQQHFFQFAQSIFCFDWKSLQNYLRWVAKLLPNTMKLYGLAVLFPWQIFQGTQAGLLVVPCSHTHTHQGPTTLWSVPFRHNYYLFELVFSRPCNTENTCFWEFKQLLQPLWKEVFYSVALLEIIWIKKKRLIAHVKVPLKKSVSW